MDVVKGRTAGDRAGTLSAEDLAALRENLLEQRLFRRGQLRQLEGAAAARAGAVSAGLGEVDVKLTEAARAVLTDVEDALARMDRGTYGRCLHCRGPIELERLTIVPQARYCGRCQFTRERRR